MLAYRYLLDLSEAETARALDWPRGTVKSRTSRALAKLRTRLGVAAVLVLAVLAALLIPPSRQALADVVNQILRLAGVQVEIGQPSLPKAPASPLPSTSVVGLAEARRQAGFTVVAPAPLGPPETVTVSDRDQAGRPRVVSLIYRDGTVRLDVFDGTLDETYLKVSPEVRMDSAGGFLTVWLPYPHDLIYRARDGTLRTETTRTAGPTLLWQRGPVTYRLEGIADHDQALAIATATVG